MKMNRIIRTKRVHELQKSYNNWANEKRRTQLESCRTSQREYKLLESLNYDNQRWETISEVVMIALNIDYSRIDVTTITGEKLWNTLVCKECLWALIGTIKSKRYSRFRKSRWRQDCDEWHKKSWVKLKLHSKRN